MGMPSLRNSRAGQTFVVEIVAVDDDDRGEPVGEHAGGEQSRDTGADDDGAGGGHGGPFRGGDADAVVTPTLGTSAVGRMGIPP